MSRVSLARRAITVTAGTMVLMGAMLVPFAGVAAAASTDCQTYSSEAGTGPTCWLRISSPNSVQTGTNFLLRVLVTTDPSRTTVASTDFCGKNAAVTITAFGPNEQFQTQMRNASGGVAYFILNFPNPPGTWDVNADATPSHDNGVEGSCSGTIFMSDFRTIEAVQSSIPLAPCPPDVSCVQASSGSGTGATIVARDGMINFTPELAGPPDGVWFGTVQQAMPAPSTGPALLTTSSTTVNTGPGCQEDGTFRGPPDLSGVLGFHLDGGTSKVKFVVFAFDKNKYPKPVNQYNICWQQDTAFTPKGGGTQVTRGYLPNCNFWDDRWERWEREDNSRRAGPPCILFRLAWNNAKYIVVIAPNDPTNGKDPFGYGH